MNEESPAPTGGTVAEVRRWYAALMASNGPGPEMRRVEEHLVGPHSIRVRVYCPIERPSAAIVYFHNGGWVSGTLEDADTVARKIAERTACAVLVPEYRLAPEHPYPAAVDDAYAALVWAGANAARLTVGGGPLLVAGEGAGGNLAAVVTLRARDLGTPTVGLQILVSPILDCDLGGTATVSADEPTLFPQELVARCLQEYLPDLAERASPEASPLRAKDLGGLPPTVLLLPEHGVAGDGSAEFVQRLSDAGVCVQSQRYRGLVHGAFSVLRLPIGEKAFQGVVRAVRAYVARPDQPLPRPADPAALV